MHPVFSPVSTVPARILSVALCALMAVAPVEGKRYDLPTAKSTNAAAGSTKEKKAKQKKTFEASGTRGTGSKKASSKAKSRATRSATRARGKKKYVSAAERRRRAARAHKIKLAFVASSQLRPMAQQLATLRTPAAYSGVAAFAHAHSGEAAAAAYLALAVSNTHLRAH